MLTLVKFRLALKLVCKYEQESDQSKPTCVLQGGAFGKREGTKEFKKKKENR